jgi:hypothetical protein
VNLNRNGYFTNPLARHVIVQRGSSAMLAFELVGMGLLALFFGALVSNDAGAVNR